MKVIVPLAGPDFVEPSGRTKAERIVLGKPFLRRALESRSWWISGAVQPKDLTFVMLDRRETRRFAAEVLLAWYPEAVLVWLSRPAPGAAFSALAALSLASCPQSPICIDLSDILYVDRIDPVAYFETAPRAGALALTFTSTNPAYSYLQANQGGMIVRAAEKIVISDNASAGTYFFRSAAVYLRALADNLQNKDKVIHNGLFYVCPVLNGVIAQGLDVHCEAVSDVVDIKL